MNEMKNPNFENHDNNNENLNFPAENHEYDPFAQKEEKSSHKWYADDFEESIKNAVPDDRAMSIYAPKPKRNFGKFFKHPAFVGIMSSLVTCAVCIGVFASTFKPTVIYEAKPIETPVASGSAVGDTTFVSKYDSFFNALTGELSISDIYEKSNPSVVSIISTTPATSYIQGGSQSSGSGIVLTEDGYLLTNNHVISGASQIMVTTMAGQEFTAKVIGTDARTDIAIIKVEPDVPLPAAELGDSAEIKVGELAIAIGNPLRQELAGTLTVGVISAIDRNVMIDGKQMTMIQTDAAINPGNSGGALLNSRGQVIGVTTAKSSGYDVEGLGFAIPINEVKPIAEALIKDGYVSGRPLIGIGAVSVTPEIARVNDLPEGIYVRTVAEFSAAERAGIRVGDVILSCQGQEVKNIDELNKIRDSHKAGDTIEMVISRDGKKMTVSVTLQEDKSEIQAQQQPQQQQQQQPQQPQQPFSSDLFRYFGW